MAKNDEMYEVKNGIMKIIDPELGISFIDTKPLGPKVSDCENKKSQFEIREVIKGKKLLEKAVFSNGKKNGQSLYFRSDGSLLLESYYREGNLHGPSKSFDTNEECLSTAWFIEGKRQGKVIFQRIQSTKFYVDGLEHGLQKYYFTDGTIKAEIPYTHGLLNGQVRLYYPSGKIKREIAFSSGKRHGFDRFWDESDALVFSFEYKNGDLYKTEVMDPVAKLYKL